MRSGSFKDSIDPKTSMGSDTHDLRKRSAEYLSKLRYKQQLLQTAKNLSI